MIFISFYSVAQENPANVLRALGGSSWGDAYTAGTDETFQRQISEANVEGSSANVSNPCTSDDQNTLPHKFLLLLMANNKLEVSHDTSSGKLRVNGGTMIGNCNSMLETSISEPNEDIPYTFQVKIKRPNNCNGPRCDYDVVDVSNGTSNQRKGTYSPDFNGFIACLQDTGVYDNGEIVADKIAPADFYHEEEGVNQSSELWFVSHGFSGGQLSGVFSENKKPNYGCYYFEDIKKDGFAIYSQDDVHEQELNRLFTRICTSGDYKLIDDHLSDFDELRGLRETLIQVRNQLVLDKVKEVHEILDESDDLSEVDVDKVRDVLADFKEYIIDPLKNKLAIAQRLYANPGHSQKEDMLRNLIANEDKVQELLGLGTSEFKDEMKKYLDDKAGELVSYAKKPYITSKDYIAMVGEDKNPPLDNSAWTGAALTLFEIQNTAFNYGRYNKNFWDDNYKGKDRYKNEDRFEKATELDRKISSNVSRRRDVLNRLNTTASNPGVDYAAQYQNTKERVVAGLDAQINEIANKLRVAQTKVQTQCAQEKAQKYWINQQACVRDATLQVEACTEQLRALVQARDEAIRKYDGMIAEWNQARTDAGLDASTAPQATGAFTFTPTNPQGQQGQLGQQGQMNPQMQQQMMMQQQQQMMQQQMMGYNQRPYSMFGNGAGFSANLGLGGQFGMSPFGGGGYNTFGYGGPQSMMGFGGYRGPSSFMPMGGGQFGYGGPMSPMMNQYTMPGGQFSFGAGAPMSFGGGAPMGGTSFNF